MGLLSWLSELRATSPREVQRRVDAIAARVTAMSPEEARIAVERLFETGGLFSVQKRAATAEEAGSVAAITGSARELLSEYQSVESGGMRVSRKDVHFYPGGAGLVAIGEDLEHSIVVVEQATGRIAVIEDDGRSEPDLSDSYPSIWHYLLFVAETSTK